MSSSDVVARRGDRLPHCPCRENAFALHPGNGFTEDGDDVVGPPHERHVRTVEGVTPLNILKTLTQDFLLKNPTHIEKKRWKGIIEKHILWRHLAANIFKLLMILIYNERKNQFKKIKE